MQIRRALWSEVGPRVAQLASKSFKEVDPRNAEDIDINLDAYEAMEMTGNYALFVAEDQEHIVAYLGLSMSESPHIRGYWQAVLDSMYVDTSARKSRIAANLISEAEKYAKSLGCSCMTIGFKANNPHSTFAKSIGYMPDDVMYTKNLED